MSSFSSLNNSSKKNQKVSAISGVPLITYHADKPSNLEAVREAYDNHLGLEFGILSKIVITGRKREEPPALVSPMPAIPGPRPTGTTQQATLAMALWDTAKAEYDAEVKIVTDLNSEARKHRQKKLFQNAEAVQRMYSSHMLQLSKEAQDKVREHSDFAAISLSVNGDDLWLLIEKVLAAGIPNQAALSRELAYQQFYSIKQGDKEAPADLKKRHEAALKKLKSTGAPDISQEDQATRLISSLNDQYSTLSLSYMNKLRAVPDTFAKAYEDIATYRVQGKAGSSITVSEATVLIAKSAPAKKEKKKSSGGGSKSNTQTETKQQSHSKPAKDRSTATSATSAPTKEKKPPTRDCPLCVNVKDSAARRHYVSECPNLEACQKKIGEGTINTFCHEDIDEEALVLTIHDEKYRPEIIATAKRTGLKNYEVLLDNQASIGCFQPGPLVSSLRNADVTIRITGVGGAIIANQLASVHLFEDLDVYCSNNMMANVLCYAHVADKYHISWEQYGEVMCFVVHAGEERIRFVRRDDIFVADFRPYIATHRAAIVEHSSYSPPPIQLKVLQQSTHSEEDDLADLPHLTDSDDSDDEEPRRTPIATKRATSARTGKPSANPPTAPKHATSARTGQPSATTSVRTMASTAPPTTMQKSATPARPAKSSSPPPPAECDDLPDLQSDSEGEDEEEPINHHVNVNTVTENKAKYSKRDIAQADLALQLIERLAFPSDRSAVNIINSSTIMNLPVSAEDVKRAFQIYGKNIASIRGKNTTRASRPIPVERSLFQADTAVEVFADIFFVDSEAYLAAIIKPQEAVIAVHLANRSSSSLQAAINKIISRLASHSKHISTLHTDGEGGLQPIIEWIEKQEIVVDVAGAGEHVKVIERAIREIKERCRAILSALPYCLPTVLMQWLIFFVISRINLTPSTLYSHNVSPRELLTGIRPSFDRDLRVSFGEYVEVHEPEPTPALKSSVREPRTDPAIALLPQGNKEGTVKFFSLSTESFVSRTRWTPLPMPNSVIGQLNSLAKADNKKSLRHPIFMRGTHVLEDL